MAASSSPAKRSYQESELQLDCDCKSKQNAIVIPTATLDQYAAAYQQAVSIDHDAKRSHQKSNLEPSCNCINKQRATTSAVAYVAPAQYQSEYQQQVPVNYLSTPSPTRETPCDQSQVQIDCDKNQPEAETYVEIVLQEEKAPTADPVSISLAYKNLAESHGKKYVAEDNLAYGHYKEPEDGRICKHVSNFDEEKLHTVDKPVVELKDCECRDGNCQNIQVSYSDIGYGPAAPSKNRFVPKTDDAIESPYAQSIVYVPSPDDKDSLPCGPVGSTIPGYKSGGVIVNDRSKAKLTCGRGGKASLVQEGSRRTVLVDEEEYENDSYDGKAKIIDQIKSSACKSGY
ncbi:uncharacterized protein LOC131663797 [Phymastichus coffea]|uniref:uncharacterized protein LOC131663797 n=1 Tax=Phymastichus coffea TaxID=108790 RepID=UPI00273BC0C2|nr:uncharacterized protein LOC131663797 [Phymastichus coffea]